MKRFALLAILLTTTAPILLIERGSAQTQRKMRIPGLLEPDVFTDKPIEAPEVAQVGKDFEISIFTSGSPCESKGGEKVMVLGNTATVRVYDFTPATPTKCNLVLQRFVHTVTLRFIKPGKATIKIVGHRHVSVRRRPFVYIHRLTVTPAERPINSPVTPSSNSSARTRRSPAARPTGA